MKCINCSKVFNLYEQCEYANEHVKECKYYENIKRKVYENENSFYGNISNMANNDNKH